MQEMAWIITIVLMLGILTVFVYVAINSQNKVEYEAVQKVSYSIRSKFFWLLFATFIILTVITLRNLPYAAQHKNISADTQNVEATGYQWYWKLSTNKVVANKPVVFNVKSADVNHGMAIYDDTLTLLTQVQAMPGYENKLQYTFTRPGNYKVMCLEYCGMAHHAMIAELIVTE